MSLKFNLNIPQKSILGFNVLSSFHSSLSCYLLLLFGRILNPLFGYSEIEIKAGALFNIILNISVLILILNLFFKRKQIRKKSFILLNLLLFIYLPISIYIIFIYIRILFSSIKNNKTHIHSSNR